MCMVRDYGGDVIVRLLCSRFCGGLEGAGLDSHIFPGRYLTD